MNRLTGVRLLAVVMALLLGGFGCSSASGDSTSDAPPANGATLEPAEFEAAMQRAGTVIVDVRTPEEFAGGHIAGALYEGARRRLAILTRRPDPGPVDTARMLPVAYVVGGFLALSGVVLVLADIISPITLF